MGVVRFYKWIKDKRFNSVVKRDLSMRIDHFMLDLNGLLHRAAQMAYAYGDFDDKEVRAEIEELNKQPEGPEYLKNQYFLYVYQLLTDVVSNVRPRVQLVLAVDGIAPAAKVGQQRQRRYKSSANGVDPVFDRNAITPFTPFMEELNLMIRGWIEANRGWLPEVVYSSYEVPGEGEHKIMSLLRRNKSNINARGENVCVYGLDADLIMLTMLSGIDNIVIMRESMTDIVDINAFKSEIKERYHIEPEDFVVLLSLIGNDFLPHPAWMTDTEVAIDTILETYRDRYAPAPSIVDAEGIQSVINREKFYSFLRLLADEEDRLLVKASGEARRHFTFNKAREYVAYVGTVADDKRTRFQFNPSRFRSEWYTNAVSNHDEETLAKLDLSIRPPSIEDAARDMSHAFIATVEWVLNYYKHGHERLNKRWIYEFHHAPLIRDLATHCLDAPEVFRDNGRGFISAYEQLLAVIPPKSVGILPPRLRKFYTHASAIADIFPERFITEVNDPSRPHESVALLPFVDLDRVLQVIRQEKVRIPSNSIDVVMRRDGWYDINGKLIGEVAEEMFTRPQFHIKLPKPVERRPPGAYAPRGGRGRGGAGPSSYRR